MEEQSDASEIKALAAEIEQYMEDTALENEALAADIEQYTEDTASEIEALAAEVEQYMEDGASENEALAAEIEQYMEEDASENEALAAEIEQYMGDDSSETEALAAEIEQYMEEDASESEALAAEIEQYMGDDSSETEALAAEIEQYMEDDSYENEALAAEIKQYMEDDASENEAFEQYMEEDSSENEALTAEIEQYMDDDASENEALAAEIEQYMEKATEQDAKLHATSSKRKKKLPATSIKRETKLPATTSCKHPGLIKDLCIKCGELVINTSGTLPFPFLKETLRLRRQEVTRLHNIDFVDIMRQKKLHLVLDLDNTLLHSTDLNSLVLEEEIFKASICPTDDFSRGTVYLAKSNNTWRRMIKLRPYVRTFLEEASKDYCLSIATYGSRSYALAMAMILDPSGCYFGTRVVSREDLTKKMRRLKKKRLDAVLGHKNVVLILDDRRDVWTSHKRNLIWIESYEFFYENLSSRQVPLLGIRYDEVEEEGALANVLKVLKLVHTRFFDPTRTDSFAERDVRRELARARVEARVPHFCSRIIGFWKPFKLSTLSKQQIMFRNEKRWRKISRMNIGLQVKIFLWRTICGALATKAWLANLINLGDDLCTICGLNMESPLHLFFYCKIVKMAWFNKWNVDTSLYEFKYTYEWFDAVCSPYENNWCSKEEEEEFGIFAFNLAHKIWRIRNNLKHQGKLPSPDPSSSSFRSSLCCVLDIDDLPMLLL